MSSNPRRCVKTLHYDSDHKAIMIEVVINRLERRIFENIWF